MTQKQHQDDKTPDSDKPQDDASLADIERRRKEDPLFIENTRPEDPSGRPGQQTRDNVTPAIPSGKRGDPPNSGGIVDPSTLGMEQGGVEPAYPPSREEILKQREAEARGEIVPPTELPPDNQPVPSDQSPPAEQPPPEAAASPETGDDPDEIEDELEQMEEEGDVTKTSKGKRKK